MKKISEFKFGEGFISSYLSLFLAILCLLGVLCFYFPEYLTTPEARQIYPVDFLRNLLSLSIFVSFSLGILGFFLSRDRKVSLISLLISTSASLLGGGQVQIKDDFSTTYYLGLDWFILDLLIVVLIFVPIEKIFQRKPQAVLREQWKTDAYHFFFSHLLIQISSFLILAPSLMLTRAFSFNSVEALIQSIHPFIQFLMILMVADFVQYWIHRAFHQIPFLWRFHSIHHSVETMDWLAGSRLHLVDIVLTRGLTLVPISLLGFSQSAVHGYLVFVAFWATFLHTNTRFQMTGVSKFFATPRFHHWHHSSAPEAIDKNFSIHLPFFDRIFKTYYLPKNQWPENYGVHNEQVPPTYWAQLIHPFLKK